MRELSDKTKSQMIDTVLRDLQPNPLKVYGKTGLAVLTGGFLSLLICGQFGVGMTSFAHHTHNQLQTHLSSFTCALVCGFLFAGLPALVLRLLCRPVEFRAIVRAGKKAPLVWLIGVGGLIAYHGEHGQELIEVAAWTLAAFGAFRVYVAGLDRSWSRGISLAS